MIIHIENTKNYLVNNSSNSKVQSIPCKILADCDANVSYFFDGAVKLEQDDTFRGSFRGIPLRGTSVNLPAGYIGVVLHESIAPLYENEERKFHVVNKFKSLNYWNWDKIPSQNDKIVQALEWIEIAEALHSPITQE